MDMRVGLYPLTGEPGCGSGGTGTAWKSGNSGSRLQAVYLPKRAISAVGGTSRGSTMTRYVFWGDPRTPKLHPLNFLFRREDTPHNSLSPHRNQRAPPWS